MHKHTHTHISTHTHTHTHTYTHIHTHLYVPHNRQYRAACSGFRVQCLGFRLKVRTYLIIGNTAWSVRERVLRYHYAALIRLFIRERERERVCVCVIMFIYVRMYIHTYIHTYIRYLRYVCIIRMYVNTPVLERVVSNDCCARNRICTRTHTHTHVCVCVCVYNIYI
jgi:hypothetical protein